METSFSLSTKTPEETTALGRLVGECCEGGEVFLLRGTLGAGKTCFCQGLARGLGVGREEAGAYIDEYLNRYRQVGVFVERTLAEARSRGFVTTLLNRRRYLPELHSTNRVQRQFAERAARNTPIQGTAADIIKMAMVRIWREMRDKRMRSRMILQVHDELLFEVPEAEVEAMTGLVRARMEGVISLDVPLKVDLKTGPNWYEMKKLEPTTEPG